MPAPCPISSTTTIADQDSFLDGVRACLPTVIGYWSVGFAAGGIGALAGYSLPQVMALGGVLYAGSAQFLFYGLDASGSGPLAITLAVLLINLRHFLMSSSLATAFAGQRGWQKVLGGLFLTDETFAVAARKSQSDHGRLPFPWLLGLNLTAYANWVFANLCGALLATALPDNFTQGLSFSLIAMFVGLVVIGLRASRHRSGDLVAILTAAFCSPIALHWVDANISILLATMAGASIAMGLVHLKRKAGYR